MLTVIPGTPYLYRSQIYTLIGIATHSETLDKMVVFRRPNNGLLWAQMLPDFPDELDAPAEPTRTSWPRIAPGKYEHFKGGQYVLEDLATDSDTKEALAVYRNPGGELWVRPAAMFLQHVDRDEYHGPRFIFRGKESKETL